MTLRLTCYGWPREYWFLLFIFWAPLLMYSPLIDNTWVDDDIHYAIIPQVKSPSDVADLFSIDISKVWREAHYQYGDGNYAGGSDYRPGAYLYFALLNAMFTRLPGIVVVLSFLGLYVWVIKMVINQVWDMAQERRMHEALDEMYDALEERIGVTMHGSFERTFEHFNHEPAWTGWLLISVMMLINLINFYSAMVL